MSRALTRLLPALLCGGALLLGGCGGDIVDGRGAPSGVGSGGSGGAGGSGSAGVAVPAEGARFADPAAVAALFSDVRAGVEALNTYDYRALDAARVRALRYTTGKLTTDYERTFTTVIAKNAPALRAVQRATVLRLGVGVMTGDSAILLGYGKLDITTTSAPDGRTDPFAVGIRAERVGGSWRIAKSDIGGSGSVAVTGGADLQAAVAAARTAAAAVSTFRRSSFDTDFARALSLTTAPLRAKLEAQKATTLAALRAGNFDLQARVTSLGVEAADGDRAVVLAVLAGYRVVNGARSGEPTTQNLRLIVDRVGGRWLVSELGPVGIN